MDLKPEPIWSDTPLKIQKKLFAVCHNDIWHNNSDVTATDLIFSSAVWWFSWDMASVIVKGYLKLSNWLLSLVPDDFLMTNKILPLKLHGTRLLSTSRKETFISWQHCHRPNNCLMNPCSCLFGCYNTNLIFQTRYPKHMISLSGTSDMDRQKPSGVQLFEAGEEIKLLEECLECISFHTNIVPCHMLKYFFSWNFAFFLCCNPGRFFQWNNFISSMCTQVTSINKYI